MSGVEFQLRGETQEPALLVRRQQGRGSPVLYVHGATFPSALSVAYRFDGHSWMDDLTEHGFDAWAFDFAGFGGSERYRAMDGLEIGTPLGRAPEAAAQIARVVEHIVATTGAERIAIVAHSWGTMPAALFASRRPARVERLCLFGPVLRREGPKQHDQAPAQAWWSVTVAQQLARFTEDVPGGHPPVLIEPALEKWGPAYLATDPASGTRNPTAVRIPNGPVVDIADAWSGTLPYRPEEILCPLLVVRGVWDSLTTDADVRWLFTHLGHSQRADVVIPKATHLMHLERGRTALFEAVRNFLAEAPS